MEATLLILAALGWLTSVLGAVLTYRGAVKFDEGAGDGTVSFDHSPASSRWGLLLVVAGASFGAGGTILAVLIAD